MSILLGMLVLTIIFYFVAKQLDIYNEIVNDKYRFRYYALRDRMAHLVADGEISEDSWEYREITNTLNFHINAVSKVSYTNKIKLMIGYFLDHENDYIKITRKTVYNEKVKAILREYIDVTSSLMRRNSRAEIWLFNTAVWCVKCLPTEVKVPRRLKEGWQVPVEKYKETLEKMDAFSRSLRPAPINI